MPFDVSDLGSAAWPERHRARARDDKQYVAGATVIVRRNRVVTLAMGHDFTATIRASNSNVLSL